MSTDKLVSDVQAGRGYQDMYPVYLRGLQDEGVVLVCTSHVVRLVQALSNYGVKVNVQAGEYLCTVSTLIQNNKS